MAVAHFEPRPGEWTPWPALEAKLAKLGIVWEYRGTVPINLIDFKSSVQNQARLGVKIDPERVEQFKLALLDGQPFPALVSYAQADGTYSLADGNHRAPAARDAGYMTVDMYVLDVPEDSIRHLVTTVINQLNGMRPTTEETIEQAIKSMDLTGRSATWIAHWYGLSQQTLNRALARRRVTARLRRIGLADTKLGVGVLEALGSIMTDMALRDATMLAAEARLKQEQVRQMVREVRDQHSEAGQLAVVQQYRESPEIQRHLAETARGAQRVPPDPIVGRRGRLFAALRNAEQLLRRFPTRQQIGLSQTDQHLEAVELALKVAQTIEALDAS